MDIFHKFPRGLKKKLAEFYGNYYSGNCGCTLCWSYNNVAIHHYSSRDYTHFGYRHDNGKIDWDDLSNFVLLCASCHGKLHSMRNWNYAGKEPPLLKCLHEVMEKYHPKLKKSKIVENGE